MCRFKGDRMMFIYGMRSRPFSIGTFPKEGFKRAGSHEMLTNLDVKDRYYDVLVYNRKLTGEELYEYELDYIGRLVVSGD